MDRSDIDRLIAEDGDTDRAKLRIDALLELERLQLEREKSEREEERHSREKRRWYANPLFVAVAVGAFSLIGDFVVSSFQGRQAIVLQKEKASSDLVISVFSEDDDQNIDNLRFLIEAGLVQDPDNKIVQAAELFRPRTVAATTTSTAARSGQLDPPVDVSVDVVRVTDGDSLRIRFVTPFDFPADGPRPEIRADQTVSFNLAGIDAPEMIYPGCDRERTAAAQRWGELARTATEAAAGPDTSGPRRFRAVIFAIDGFGRAHGVLVREGGQTRDPELKFERTVNAALLMSGMAVPYHRAILPREMAEAAADLGKRADDAGAGIYAAMSPGVDLEAKDFGVVNPWLFKRICSILRRDVDPAEYFREYFEAVAPQDIRTGMPINPGEVIRVDGRRIEQLRPMHGLHYAERDR